MPNTLIKLHNSSGQVVSPAVGVNKPFIIYTSAVEGVQTAWVDVTEGETVVAHDTTITVNGVTANMNGICSLDMSAISTTNNEYVVAAECQIRVVGQGTNTINVRVTEIPSIPIHCNLMLLGEESNS